jgi:hypothetical protein
MSDEFSLDGRPLDEVPMSERLVVARVLAIAPMRGAREAATRWELIRHILGVDSVSEAEAMVERGTNVAPKSTAG